MRHSTIMTYSDELKKETAKKLKKLRLQTRDSKGKYFSHATLSEELTKLYDPISYENENECRVISNKSLAYYEVVNPNNISKFRIGKGMKVETLFMLANFYDVSCDYLLGLKKEQTIGDYSLSELTLELGLDSYSKEALVYMMKYNINYKEEILTINNVIHSFTDKIADADETTESPKLSNTQDIEAGFLYLLARYLFYTSGEQKIRNYPNMQYFGDEILNEDELSNLLLLEIQKNLQKSRDKHKKLRRYPLKKVKRFLARRDEKQKEQKNV